MGSVARVREKAWKEWGQRETANSKNDGNLLGDLKQAIWEVIWSNLYLKKDKYGCFTENEL